jgi:hypothetical protein
MEQRSAPIYRQLNGQFTFGGTRGFDNFHIGITIEGAQPLKLKDEETIKDEVKEIYPNIPR